MISRLNKLTMNQRSLIAAGSALPLKNNKCGRGHGYKKIKFGYIFYVWCVERGGGENILTSIHEHFSPSLRHSEKL